MLSAALVRTARCALGAVLASLAACSGALAATPPLAPGSPWPKFRADLAQTGRAAFTPRLAGRPWSFHTGKGIFSSPVIGADGTVYIGSADDVFYALTKAGRVRWKRRTGEIIDSAALLDDRGRVYVPSADGHLYALDARTGRSAWTFAADPPTTTGAFINWFEGNVAMDASGTLYAPNDNRRTYAIDRDTGRPRWAFPTNDQTWSSPAYDAAQNRMAFGSNFFLLGVPSVFSVDAATGQAAWSAATDGATVASPLVTGRGLTIVGSFDGFLRAYDSASGAVRWSFATRDHIYASPAELPDGTIVQPSADGSIYGLDPATGRLRWQYDTLAPIRSSPAVDALGRIYVGTGDGRLLVLNPNGRLRWSIRLAAPPRGTLNSSPALGHDAIVIADSNGDVHSVPYDWCLRGPGLHDARCVRAEGLPRAGARLHRVTPFGLVERAAPTTIGANQPLALELDVRRAGHTVQARLDPARVRVSARPAATLRVRVTGDRRQLIVIPAGALRAGGDGRVNLAVSAGYLTGGTRHGLSVSGGTPGGTAHTTLRLRVLRGSARASDVATVPARPGAPATVWRMSRLALSLPTLLPSYNQIGFDRLNFLMGVLAPLGHGAALGWMVGATATRGGRVSADPATHWRVPFIVRRGPGLLSFTNNGGARFELNGFENANGFWRMAARVGRGGRAAGPMDIAIDVDCAKVGFYGQALEGLGACTPTAPMTVFGAGLLTNIGAQRAPALPGLVTFSRSGGALVATLHRGAHMPALGHVLSVVAVDRRTGLPLPLDYSYGTVVRTGPGSTAAVRSVRVPLGRYAHTPLRALLVVDAGAVAAADLG
ncbi:MAG TPA: PQQ-binding-like beta-propeller repeat protein [Solirubrobacteraceae bacterium]|nr:PQQ-binding-like beta-propeller repeat protein [Solirubrobacteraceae bacterium]